MSKYSLDSYIISLTYKNDKDLRVLSKIKLSEMMILDNRVFQNFKNLYPPMK